MNTCPVTGNKHIPNWDTSKIVQGALPYKYLDIQCADCKEWGCVGEIKVLEETITWEE